MSFHKSAFFRESSWMVLATFVGGVCMFGVHFFGIKLSRDEYGILGLMLNILNVITIPALALQTVFARQAASAVTPENEAVLRSTVKGVMKASFLLWLALLVVFLGAKPYLLSLWKLPSATPLYVVAGITLLQFWAPVLLGVMQGRQNFLWFGWANILNGAGRLAAVGLILTFVSASAAGATIGVMTGITATFLIGLIHTKDVLKGGSPNFRLGQWVVELIPLTLALGVTQFMLSADYLYFRANYSPEDSGPYNGAAMIGKGLVMFSAPLVMVMFPKVARNNATGTKSRSVLFYTLAATFGLCTLGAAGATVAAFMIQAINANPSQWEFLPLTILGKLNSPGGAFMGQWVPWFVWCMLPLAMANVLLNNLIAQNKFRVLPWLIGVGVIYVLLLKWWGGSVKGIILALGTANVLLVAVTSLFTFPARAGVGEP